MKGLNDEISAEDTLCKFRMAQPGTEPVNLLGDLLACTVTLVIDASLKSLCGQIVVDAAAIIAA